MKRYFIGTSGWNYDHWEGRFYPKGMPKSRWLEFYSKEFDTVEVNYSFYRWPSEKTMKNWHERAPAGFTFTLKAPRTITHVKKLNDVGRQVRDFYRLTALLKDRAGCHLFQLPPSFRATDINVGRVRKFLELLDAGKDNAVEFRHGSWWSGEIYELFRDRGTAFCTVSGIGMPEEAVCTSDIAYLRFHEGSRSGRYSMNELRKYADVIRKLKAVKVYCYFNNDSDAFAVRNAKELEGLLNF